MKHSTSTRSDAPAYPTREQVAADPSLLGRELPKSWQADEVLGAVAAFAVAANAACTPAFAASPDAPKATAVVAPVSNHGSGFATSGCDIVAPPVFLSEEEALKVIKDESARRGLKLQQGSPEIQGVKVFLPKKSNSGEEGPREPRGFKPDLADPKHHVAVEFVSGGDAYYYQTPGSSEPKMIGLKETIQTKQGAQNLAAHVEKSATERIYFGTFYDPGGNNQDIKATKQKNAEMLRAQVADFLDWLKAQGAL